MKLNITSFILLITTVLFITSAFSEVPPEPNTAEIGVSVVHSGNNATFSTVIAIPFDRSISGYLALSGQHVHDDGESDLTTRLAYIEAGLPIKRFEINGFAKALSNTERGLERQIDYGYFVQLNSKQRRRVARWNFSAGFGNFARNEIVELAEDAHTSFNWKAFLRAQNIRGLALQFDVNSNIDLSDFEYTLSPSHSFDISDRFNLSVDVNLIWADDTFHSSSTLNGNVLF